VDIYTLDSLYRMNSVIDTYQSFIWTERMRRYGDFELDVASTLANRSLYKAGLRLSIPQSKRVMVVETTEDDTDNEGRKIIKVTGRSLETILTQRLAMGALTDLTTDPKWEVTGVPKAVAAQLFHDICVTGILDPGDVIAGVVEGSIFPADTLDAPTDVITYSIEPKTLYDAETTLCDAFSMGFRLVLDPTTHQLYFDVYMGCDRTTGQTSLPAIIFSPNMESITSTKVLTSNAGYANVAYVVSPVGHEVVYPLDVDPDIAGMDRRVLFVQATDITDTVPADASAKMIQRGVEALAQNRQFTVLDGEVAQNNQFVYGVDYNVGDMVELENDDGLRSKMQITEQIFVSDQEGDRSYPTLEVNSFVTPGSWLASGPTLVWSDKGATEYWSTEP